MLKKYVAPTFSRINLTDFVFNIFDFYYISDNEFIQPTIFKNITMQTIDNIEIFSRIATINFTSYGFGEYVSIATYNDIEYNYDNASYVAIVE